MKIMKAYHRSWW